MSKNRKIIIFLLAVIIIISVIFLVVFKKDKKEENILEAGDKGIISYFELGATSLNKNNLLQFCDAATGEKTILCGKPKCKHNNKECNALLEDYYVPLAAIHNDKLYLVMEDEDFNSILYEADINGSNRKEILSLDKFNFSFNSLFLDNYLIMGYSKDYELEDVDSEEITRLEKPISGVAIINLKEQEVDYIPEKVDYDGYISKVHMYEDKIYYLYTFKDVQYKTQDFESYDLDYASDHTFDRLYSYDVKTEEESILYEGQDIYFEEFGDNYAFIRKNKESEEIYAFNLLNQEKEELIIEKNSHFFCWADDKRLVYHVLYKSSPSEDIKTTEEVPSHFYYYDMISRENCYIGSTTTNKLSHIYTFSGDYAYISYYTQSDGPISIFVRKAGCITKDDFYNGNFDKVIKLD